MLEALNRQRFALDGNLGVPLTGTQQTLAFLLTLNYALILIVVLTNGL